MKYTKKDYEKQIDNIFNGRKNIPEFVINDWVKHYKVLKTFNEDKFRAYIKLKFNS